MKSFIRRLQGWWTARSSDADLADELEFHRAMTQDRFERQGLPPDDAAAASRRTLGNVTLAREDARRVWIPAWIEDARQDAGYAWRMLRRNPGFAAAMILVLSLGIGSTTGVFALVDELVLRSLPVRQPERLVYFTRPSFSYPVFTEVRTRSAGIFSQLFAWNLETVNVRWFTRLESTEVLMASGEFYSTLGLTPSIGRLLTPDDDRIGGGRDGLVAVISDGCWRRRFGADPGVIGRVVAIDRRPFTIVGVTPRGFFGVAPGLSPDITIPLTAIQDSETLRRTSGSWLHMMGRLRDGLSVASANAAFQSIWPGVLEATTSPDEHPDRRRTYLGRATSIESARTGFSRVRNQFEEPLWLLLALVSLLLTVACASAANLLLARSAARRREFAVRLAIGAGRRRLVRQVFTEALVVTGIGAAGGMAVATLGARTLVAMMVTRDEPISLTLTPDLRLVAFAAGIAVATALVAAVLPALRAARANPGAPLKGWTHLGSDGRHRSGAGAVLVTAQVALSVVLLFGAALFIRSLNRILSEDTGFDRTVVVVVTDAVAAGYGDERLAAFHRDLRGRLASLPGVESTSMSWYPPISDEDGAWTQSVAIDGAPIVQDPTRYVHFNGVSPDYFRTLGMRLIAGRDFNDGDRDGSPGVVIVNESFVRRFFPAGGSDPGQTPMAVAGVLARVVSIGRHERRQNLQIVGVVGDAKYQRLQEPSRRIAYMPAAQIPAVAGENLVTQLRLLHSHRGIADAVRAEVARIDPDIPVRIETVNDRIRTSLVTERVITTLASVLGIAALALACAALYGLLSYMVSRRTNEIGLRMALGAARSSVVWMVLRHSLLIGIVGTAVGVGTSLALGRFARNLLYSVSPSDALAIAGASTVMLLVCAGAGLLPAYRAATIDPVAALRE